MWNRKQKRFQNTIELHVLHSLPYDSVYRNANGSAVYCHPSKEIECKVILEAFFNELAYPYTTYPTIIKRIMEKYPHA